MRRQAGAVRLHRAVVDVASDLLGDGRGDDVRGGALEVHPAAGSVAVEPVGDVEALLEVVAQGEVEERPPRGGQLHRGRQPALNHSEVAGGEVAVEILDKGTHLQTVGRGQGCRVDARSGNDDHPQLGDELRCGGEGRHDPAQQARAHARATDRDQADALVRAVAELGAQALAVSQLGLVEAGDVAGEVEVALGPLADPAEARAEAPADDVVGVADEDRPVADLRVIADVLDHLGVVVRRHGCLPLAVLGHRQPADEVRQPGEGRALSALGSRAGGSRAPRPRRRSRGHTASR